MPWKRAKARPPPDNTLFNECFRIQREASEAAGHYIPLIVENVRGAQKWVGRARWNYGSFYLWGDVPALMPVPGKVTKSAHGSCKRLPGAQGGRISGWPHVDKSDGTKFSQSGDARFDGKPRDNPDGRKVSMNFHEHEKTGKLGRSFQSAAVEEMGIKQGGDWFGKDCESSMSRLYGSKSPKRKMASAMIAKIPLPLSLHIARTFKPR